MNKKSFFLIFLSLCVLSSCGNHSDVSQGVVSESETSVTSESRADLPQLSDSVNETAESDTEEIADSAPIFASGKDKAAFELLGDYTAEHLAYPNRHVELHVSGESWEKSEDYELFRKYFFGSWGETPLVIDDSESAFIAENCHAHYFMDFYKVSEDVLAFRTGSAAGGALFWLDKNEPDTLYEAEGTPGESPNGIFSGEDGFPNVWVLHKNDTEPNEPENNYLSVYRLREMAQKYGIDYELLVNIELEAIPWSGHDSGYYFYPIYLVSEEENRIEIITRAGDLYSYDVGIRIILQNIDGKWNRTVEIDDATT